MLVAYAGRTVDGAYLLLVGVLLNTLLSIVHDGHNILHLLVHTCKDVGFVAHLEKVAAKGGVHVEITECVAVKSQNLRIQSTVVEALVLILSSQLTWCGHGNELIEFHEVHVSTDGSLQLQVVGDVPDSLGSQAEDVFCRVVLILIEVPVGILVILVITIPVGVCAVSVLIGLQPFLVVSAGQRHQVLTDVAL